MAKRKKASTKPKSSSPEKSHVPYILLVEDEPTHVAVMSHTIRSANPNVVVKVAGSLKEYRSAIAKSLPDIALIDMHLPDGKALRGVDITAGRRIVPDSGDDQFWRRENGR